MNFTYPGLIVGDAIIKLSKLLDTDPNFRLVL